LVRDPEISGVLQDISQSDVVIHGIGLASEMARRRGYDSVALARLRENKAVTECFGCFFDEEGHVVERIRQVGLQFENLTNVPHILAIALGTRKAKAIKAYMRNAPHQTWLITDEAAANQILNGSSRLK
jgi:central glycolytic genes regulator